jgi:hypothetical protein
MHPAAFTTDHHFRLTRARSRTFNGSVEIVGGRFPFR